MPLKAKSRNIVTTARGRKIDFEKLRRANETATAVGNDGSTDARSVLRLDKSVRRYGGRCPEHVQGIQQPEWRKTVT